MSFEWQTAEEWSPPAEETASPPPPAPEKKPPRVRFIVAGVVLLMALLLGFGIWQTVDNRVESATDIIEEDLLSSAALVQQTAVNRDADLFLTLLSGRDDEWAAGMETAVAAGVLYDRPGFDLTWIPRPVVSSVISRTLSSDLLTAELLTENRFALSIGNGLTETIRLQQSLVYRKGEDRWLIAPPEREFWGGRVEVEGRYLTVRFWERDEMLGRRLAADLETTVSRLCNSALLNCDDDFHLRYIFIEDPAALTYTPRTQLAPDLENRINVPTPTLVGIPVDEAGYRALLRGYQAQLINGVIVRAGGENCCAPGAFLQGVADLYLVEMGVRPSPFGAQGSPEIPADFSLYSAAAAWELEPAAVDPPALQEAAIMLHFLREEIGVPLPRLLTALAQYPAYQTWLMAVTGDRYNSIELERRWLQFAAERSGATVSAAPVPFPGDQALYLICENPAEGSGSGLYRYTPEREFEFVERLAGTPAYQTGLPDDRGLAMTLVVERSGADDGETFLWVDGRRYPLDWTNFTADLQLQAPIAFPSIADPTGSQLLWTLADVDGLAHGLLDLTACLDGGDCAPHALMGYPVWSPDGSQMMGLVGGRPLIDELTATGFLTLMNPDGSLQEEGPGRGSSPFWQSNDRYGYLTVAIDGFQQVLSRSISGERNRILFDTELVLDDFPAEPVPERVFIHTVHLSPVDRNTLLLTTIDETAGVGNRYLFSYDIADDSFSFRYRIEDEAAGLVRGYRFSPDGRFYTITSLVNPVQNEWQLIVHDVAGLETDRYLMRGSSLPVPMHWHPDWSADGDWLAFSSEGLVTLALPAYDSQYLLPAPSLNCNNPVWADR